MKRLQIGIWLLAALLMVIIAARHEAKMPGAPRAWSTTLACDADNDGLQLPEGFCVIVVADTLGWGRHLTVRDNGDIYVALRQPTKEGSIAALRDTTGDGRADIIVYFGEEGGTGIHLRGDYLYFAPDTVVMRYPLGGSDLLPTGDPESVVLGFPRQQEHAAKPFEFDEQGWMYVTVGSLSNACQDPPRTRGAPGLDPCPQLEDYAGIWRFKADSLGQTMNEDGYRYATGIRNAVANAWNPFTQKLYVASHGRGILNALWPDLYTEVQNSELPSEEFFVVEEGSDSGWPYCYYDHLKGKKVLNPEYGGDGEKEGRCAEVDGPILGFPAHWAPNDLLFYTGRQFPEKYLGGAFIAFHGSGATKPSGSQRGFRVVFIPFEGEAVAGPYEVFADGFIGADTLAVSSMARYRPMGLAVGPDGSLYISDSKKGRVWRVMYTGKE